MTYKYIKKANLHLHSNYSDGIHSVHSILKMVQKRGFDVIAITDHNEIKGSLKAFELGKKQNLLILPGIEIFFKLNRKIKELLIYFENPEELKSFYEKFIDKQFMLSFSNMREFEVFIKEIRKLQGAIVLPHPSSKKGFARRDFKTFDFDGFEIISASHKLKQNKELTAFNFACKDKLQMGGADFHIWPAGLNSAYTLLNSNNAITQSELFANLIRKKKTIEFVPTGKPLPFLKRFTKLIITSPNIIYYLFRKAF